MSSSVTKHDPAQWLDAMLAVVRNQLSKPSFDTWFSQLSIQSVSENGHVVFTAPNTFTSDWLETRYSGLVADAWTQATGRPCSVSFTTLDRPANGPTARQVIGDIERMDAEERTKLAQWLKTSDFKLT